MGKVVVEKHDYQLKKNGSGFGDPYAWMICTKCGEWKGLVETKCENKTNAKNEGEV